MVVPAHDFCLQLPILIAADFCSHSGDRFGSACAFFRRQGNRSGRSTITMAAARTRARVVCERCRGRTGAGLLTYPDHSGTGASSSTSPALGSSRGMDRAGHWNASCGMHSSGRSCWDRTKRLAREHECGHADTVWWAGAAPVHPACLRPNELWTQALQRDGARAGVWLSAAQITAGDEPRGRAARSRRAAARSAPPSAAQRAPRQ